MKERARAATIRGDDRDVIMLSDPDLTAAAAVHSPDEPAATGTINTPSSSVINTGGIELGYSGAKKRAGSSVGDSTRNAIHGNGGTDPSGGGEEAQKLPTRDGGGHHKSNHLTGVAVCVVGAVMSSMLQFAFVYGENSRCFCIG